MRYVNSKDAARLSELERVALIIFCAQRSALYVD